MFVSHDSYANYWFSVGSLYFASQSSTRRTVTTSQTYPLPLPIPAFLPASREKCKEQMLLATRQRICGPACRSRSTAGQSDSNDQPPTRSLQKGKRNNDSNNSMTSLAPLSAIDLAVHRSNSDPSACRCCSISSSSSSSSILASVDAGSIDLGAAFYSRLGFASMPTSAHMAWNFTTAGRTKSGKGDVAALCWAASWGRKTKRLCQWAGQPVVHRWCSWRLQRWRLQEQTGLRTSVWAVWWPLPNGALTWKTIWRPLHKWVSPPLPAPFLRYCLKSYRFCLP